MVHSSTLLAVAGLLAAANAQTATVTLSAQIGAPSHLASGLIYGIPDTQNQIPAQFYTGMGFNYGRAGGAQLPSPSRGWVYSTSEYSGRFNSGLSNYKTTRKYGGRYQLLLHDLWGTDTGANIYPGDNGDWTSYDNFLNRVISDINANAMTTGLDLEIWNEPDLPGVFWNRSQDQWIQMWGRGYARLRQAFGTKCLIVGPSLAGQPNAGNTWWTNWLKYIGPNNSQPDQYTWHIEGDVNSPEDDPQANVGVMKGFLSTYKLATKPFNINEYAVKNEQQPAGAAWWISRLERNNLIGLRGNWLGGAGPLHDFLASLLSKPGAGTSSYSATGTGYYANGEWQVYSYYATNMTGQRVATTGSADNKFDVYATSDGTVNGVRMLCGPRLTDGVWDLTVKGLTAVGLPTSGTVNIRTYRFDYNGEFGAIGAPVDMGVVPHDYTNNAVTFFVAPANQRTAYAFQFQK